MTRATTASTSRVAASRCGSSSAPSTCSESRFLAARRQVRRLDPGECHWQLDWLMRMQVPLAIRCPGWLSTVCMALGGHRCRAGRTRTPPNEYCIGPRPPRLCIWPPLPQRALGCSARLSPDTRNDCWRRPAPRTTRPGAIPDLIAPDDHARFGGGPYADDELEDDFYWAAAELWLATNEEVYCQEVLSSTQHSADAFDPAGFDFDRVTVQVGSISRWLAATSLTTIGWSTVCDRARTDYWSCSAGSPGVSRTRPLRVGTGAPTAGSSITSWYSQWRSW